MLFYTSEFTKQLKKLPKKVQQKVKQRLLVFEEDEFDKILGNHKLHGEHLGSRSIDITGNYRVIYKKPKEGVYVLVSVGTHPQLYG